MNQLFSEDFLKGLSDAADSLAKSFGVVSETFSLTLIPAELQRSTLKSAMQHEVDKLDPLEQIVVPYRVEVTVPGYMKTSWHDVKSKGKTKPKVRRRKIKTWVPVQEYLLEKSDVETIAEEVGLNMQSLIVKNETLKGYDPNNADQEKPETRIVIERLV